MAKPQNLGVVVLLLNKKANSVLLGKRKNGYAAGSYGLPGGRAEWGERIEDSAKRELQEETAIETKNLTLFAVVRDERQPEVFFHCGFICEDWDGEPLLSEPEKCERWEWLPLSGLPKDIVPGHQKILEFLIKNGQDGVHFLEILS